jgi:chemotaxis protein histidine kinase CheA
MSDLLSADLRRYFRDATTARIEEMHALLDRIEHDGADRQSLDKLERHFHALSGLGATYGFVRISELGDEGEGSMASLSTAGSAPAAELVRRWRELVAEVATVLKDRPPCGPPDAS